MNSKRGLRFRLWATMCCASICTASTRRDWPNAVCWKRGRPLDLLARTLRNQTLVDDTGRAVRELIVGYAYTWRLLLEYDENRLALSPGARPSSAESTTTLIFGADDNLNLLFLFFIEHTIPNINLSGCC